MRILCSRRIPLYGARTSNFTNTKRRCGSRQSFFSNHVCADRCICKSRCRRYTVTMENRSHCQFVCLFRMQKKPARIGIPFEISIRAGKLSAYSVSDRSKGTVDGSRRADIVPVRSAAKNENVSYGNFGSANRASSASAKEGKRKSGLSASDAASTSAS